MKTRAMDTTELYGLFLVLFIVGFIGMVIWVYGGKRKADFEKAGSIPFADDPRHDTTQHREMRQ